MKQNPLRRGHLDDFIKCFRPGEMRESRIESERFKAYDYEDLITRDKANLDLIFMSKSRDADALPEPDVIAQEIVGELEVATAEFSAIAESLKALRSSRESSATSDRSNH
jgi:type I restriction enzyme M protein